MKLTVAMLSVHTCPLAALGGKETGGMNVYVRQVACELGRMGVHVDVFTRSQNPTIPRVVELGPGARVVHLPAGPEAPMARAAVHAHLEQFATGVEEFALDQGLAYDLIHSHYWLSGVAGLRLRETWGAPLVQMFHTLGRLKNSVAQSDAELEPTLRLDEEARIVAQADRVVAANVVERAHLVWHYGARTERIAVIPCGVDTDLFQPMDPAKAKDLLELPPDPMLLYVGRLQPIKGLDTLLEAMTMVPEPARLLIVGGEQDARESAHGAALRGSLAALGLERRVHFLSAQPQRRLRLFYAAADATVVPSHYESFGMVALEAMACGSPVVASRVGGLPSTIRDGVTGFLVGEGDVVDLTDRLGELLEDGDLRARLGAEGVRWAAGHRWPCVAEAICREYADLQPLAREHIASPRCHGER